MFLRQLAVSPPADDTCQWLYDTPSFRAWIERSDSDKHHGLLQIIGKPGSGKSTLMRSLFDHTRSMAHKRNDGTCVVGHFFNCRGQILERCAKGLFHSLFHQLGTLYPPSLGVLKVFEVEDLRDLELTAAPYLSALQSGLKQIFSDPALSPRRTAIFIDALDECDEAFQVGYFFAELTRLACKHGTQLDICISRREYPAITVKDCLEIRMEAYNLQDIQRYISQKMDLAYVPFQDAIDVCEAVALRSGGIFLWVVLAVEGILKDFERERNAKQVLRRTKSLPKALEDLFAQIIEGMDRRTREMALRLFQWAVLPTDRLRIREWHHILAFLRAEPPISLREWKESVHYTETDAQLERRIRDLSRGLVEVKGGIDMTDSAVGDDGSLHGSLLAGAGSLDSTTGDSRVVQPIHETVADFLTSGRANRWFKQGRDYDFIGEGHLAIASACLDYIDIAEFDKLIAARKRHCSTHNQHPSPEYKFPRRQRSTTSFMSSASSHSIQYHHEHVSTSPLLPTYPTDPRAELNPEPGADIGRALDSDTIFHHKSPETSSPEAIARAPLVAAVGKAVGAPPSPAPELAVTTTEPRSPIGGDGARSSDVDIDKRSNMSRTLEEYPALTSYALNRVFDHAQKAHALGANLGKLLEKLTVEGCWNRWYYLQEGVTDQAALSNFLHTQGLGSWIPPAQAQPIHDPAQVQSGYMNLACSEQSPWALLLWALGKLLPLSTSLTTSITTSPTTSPTTPLCRQEVVTLMIRPSPRTHGKE